MELRLATPADAQALLAIYAHYIDTPVTFQCALPSVAEYASLIRQITAQYPFLVCQQEGQILGFAYAHRQREREAYQWNAELSIYLAPAFHSRGLGRRLYWVLLELLRLQGVQTAYGAVALPNEKSEALHLSLGFQPLGTYHRTGFKCGQWRDVRWYEKPMGDFPPDPAPLRPIGALPAEEVQRQLRSF